jgi:hypothetical protein
MARRRTLAGLTILGVMAAAGIVVAQPAPPAPPVQAPPLAVPPPDGGPAAAPAEEAPPAQVTAPVLAPAPPIEAEEVEAAPPPKAQVAAKPTEAAIKRARYDVAVIQALDKVSAESMRFEASIGRPVRYKNLVFTVNACERSAPDEAAEDSMAYLTVESQPRSAPGKPTPPPRQTFRGWMYASSPGLHPLEHPVYDAWLITCRAASPPVAAR